MLKVSSISLGYFWIFEGFWNFSANCVSSRHCSEVPHICRIFPNFFIIFVCNPSSVLILSCMSVSSKGREQERRTKKKWIIRVRVLLHKAIVETTSVQLSAASRRVSVVLLRAVQHLVLLTGYHQTEVMDIGTLNTL